MNNSLMQEIIAYYEGTPGQKNWFKRKMQKLTKDDQDKIWTELKKTHNNIDYNIFAKTQQKRSKKAKIVVIEEPATKIFWTDEEWDQIADLVWRTRKNDPTQSIINLCNKIMDHFPKERRRKITNLKTLKPLIERLTEKDKSLLDLSEQLQLCQLEIDELQKELENRNDQLNQLTDEEIFEKFGEKVLQNCSLNDVVGQFSAPEILSNIPLNEIVNHYLSLGMEFLTKKQNDQNELLLAIKDLVTFKNDSRPPMPTPFVRPSVVKPRLPKVAIVGLLPVQQQAIAKALDNKIALTFIDKNRKDGGAIPNHQDGIVVMANFVSHPIQNNVKNKIEGTKTQLIIHHGGTSELINKLNEAVCDKIGVKN